MFANDNVQQISKVITQRIRMEGFIVFDHFKEYPTARKELAQWLAEGKIKRQETIVSGGLKVAEQALGDLFKGGNTGEYSSKPRSGMRSANVDRKTPCRGQIPRGEEQAVIKAVPLWIISYCYVHIYKHVTCNTYTYIPPHTHTPYFNDVTSLG